MVKKETGLGRPSPKSKASPSPTREGQEFGMCLHPEPGLDEEGFFPNSANRPIPPLYTRCIETAEEFGTRI